MPPESRDAHEYLPKEAPSQVALGQLEHEVPSMPDEAPAGLEEPLLETREGPALDGDGQDEPTQHAAPRLALKRLLAALAPTIVPPNSRPKHAPHTAPTPTR